MRNLLCYLLLVALPFGLFAQDKNALMSDDDYLMNMKMTLKVMNMGQSLGQYQQVVKGLDHFAQERQDDWLPPYYAAYTYVQMVFMANNNKQKAEFIEKAQFFIDQAKEREENNAEILVVQAYIYQAAKEAEPELEEQYDDLFSSTLEDAALLDPQNPRVDYLRAENEFFNSSLNKDNTACPLIQKALAKFDQQKEEKTENELLPIWGEDLTRYMGMLCEKKK